MHIEHFDFHILVQWPQAHAIRTIQPDNACQTKAQYIGGDFVGKTAFVQHQQDKRPSIQRIQPRRHQILLDRTGQTAAGMAIPLPNMIPRCALPENAAGEHAARHVTPNGRAASPPVVTCLIQAAIPQRRVRQYRQPFVVADPKGRLQLRTLRLSRERTHC